MRYNADKVTGNSLSVLGMGCMRFPRSLGAIDMAKTEEIIQEAVEGGINYFDTAYIYPGSERALGEILHKNGLREKVFIATKMPVVMLKSASDFTKFFEKQLERLKTDYIDYYLMHMLTDMEMWEKLMEWGVLDFIRAEKQKGRIKSIGFSFHGTQESFLKILDSYPWEFCQIQYNYMNENYQAGVTGLRKAHEKGVPVVIMEPLLGGRLAVGLPDKAVKAFAELGDASPASWALKWLWNQQEPAVVLSGMNDLNALRDNLKTAEHSGVGTMTERELAVIENVKGVINSFYKVKCTGCGYCIPCPKNVNIPACFSAYNTYSSLGKTQGISQYITGTGGTAGVSGRAGQCVGCRKCEAHCPQGIAISDELANVKRVMEPFWLRLMMKVGRAFAGFK